MVWRHKRLKGTTKHPIQVVASMMKKIVCLVLSDSHNLSQYMI